MCFSRTGHRRKGAYLGAFKELLCPGAASIRAGEDISVALKILVWNRLECEGGFKPGTKLVSNTS